MLRRDAERPMPPASMPVIDPVNAPPSTPQRFMPRAGEKAEPIAAPRQDAEVRKTAPIEAVQTASRAFATLREGERELRFEATDTGMRIEVYDGHGRLVRAIPPNAQMAAALAGDEVTEWQA